MYLVANGLPTIDEGRPDDKINCQLRNMEEILKTEAVEYLSTEDVIGLMKLMTRDPKVNWDHRLQPALCELPAVDGISLEQITKEGDGLLELAVRGGDSILVQSCLEVFPAGEHIKPDTIVRVLEVLIEPKPKRVAALAEMLAESIPSVLINSSAGRRIDRRGVARLINLIMHSGNKQHEGLMREILSIPQAKRLGNGFMLKLLRYVRIHDWHNVEPHVAANISLGYSI